MDYISINAEIQPKSITSQNVDIKMLKITLQMLKKKKNTQIKSV